MKVSKIVLVLAIALAVASIAVPAGAWLGPFGGFGCGIPFGGFGFGGGATYQSSFVASSSFSTFGGAGFGCGIPFGIGGCGMGGCGMGGCGMGGFGSPFGFC
jgi:hypothetical protein